MACTILDLANNSWMYIEDGGLNSKGEIVKKPKGSDERWTFQEAEQKMKASLYHGNKMIGVGMTHRVRLRDTGIICIDFDDKDITLDMIYSQFPFLQNTLWVAGNRKGFHFYVKCTYNGKKLDKKKLTFNGDVVFDVYELDKKKWSQDEVKEITMEEFKLLRKDEPESVSSSFSSSILKPITTEEREMLDLIPSTEYTDYLPWVMFCSACKNSWADGIQVADHYSKLADGYNGIEDVESRAKMNTNKGYLVNLVKKHNPVAWREIQQIKIFSPKHNMLSTFEVADFLIKTTDTVVKVKDQLYYYEHNYWHLDDTPDRNHVKRILMCYLREVLHKLIKKACYDLGEDVENQEKKKYLTKLQGVLVNWVNKPSEANKIISEFNTYTLNADITFDNKPYLFCFKNCGIDLKTNQLYSVQKEDYITMYADYEWTPSSPEDIQFIADLFDDILPNKDVRECKISTLRCGMIGLCFENFVMESGSGGNGKDVLSNLYNSALTSTYFYKGSTSTLLDMKIKSGGNPEVANMNKKRFVVFCEPPSSSTLNMGVLKDITGGGTINARQLYSKNCETRLENITSFICNERPNVGGDIGDAEMRRFINIPYTQVYSTNEEKIKRGAKRANLYYKTKDFQDKYKCHLINYLLTFDYIEPYIPKCIYEETQRYLFDSDNTSSYFADKVIFTEDETDYITLADLTALFKEQFSTGSKEFRGMNSKKLLDILKRNVVWKDKVTECFVEGRCLKKNKNGKKMDISNVFLKMKFTDQEDEEPENT